MYHIRESLVVTPTMGHVTFTTGSATALSMLSSDES